MTVYVKVNPTHLKEKIVESAIAHGATVEEYGVASSEAEASLALLVHYADHFYWLLYPEEKDSEGEPVTRETPAYDSDLGRQRLALTKLQHEALLLKRGY